MADTLILDSAEYFRVSGSDTISRGTYSLDEEVVNFDNYIEPDVIPARAGRGRSVIFYLSRNNISGNPNRIIVSQDHGIVFRRVQ